MKVIKTWIFIYRVKLYACFIYLYILSLSFTVVVSEINAFINLLIYSFINAGGGLSSGRPYSNKRHEHLLEVSRHVAIIDQVGCLLNKIANIVNRISIKSRESNSELILPITVST